MEPGNEELARELAGVYLLMRRKFDQVMMAEGGSLARTRLLMCIASADGKIRAADIAEMLSQAPRTVTQGIDALERDGLITRESDLADRRVKRLSLTEAGHKVVLASEPLRRALVDDVFGTLTDADRVTLKAILEKLKGQLPVE